MQTLLNLLAAIALLVWGTHIVRTGVLRVGGASLRQILRRSVSHRWTAFAAGVGVTGLLQSSTATALLSALVRRPGRVQPVGGARGHARRRCRHCADGPTVLAEPRWLAPLLIVVGVIIYLAKRTEQLGQIGKVILGLGVMILALQLITAATTPLVQAAGVRTLFRPVDAATWRSTC